MASLGDSYEAVDELAAEYFAAVRDNGRESGPARGALARAHSVLLAHGALLSRASRGSPEGDVVGRWARARVRVLHPDELGWTPNSELAADLRAWCASVGTECPDHPSRAVGRHLGAMGARPARARARGAPQERGWRVKLPARVHN